MVINWFSPLGPCASGIAQFTRFLLPELTRLAEVRLWTSQPQITAQIASQAQIVHYFPGQLTRKHQALLFSADRNIYNLGNHSLYHSDILDMFLQYPGEVILHEKDLQDLFRGHFQTRYSMPQLTQLLETHHGCSKKKAFLAVQSRWQKAQKDGPRKLAQTVARRAQRLWVHTEECRRAFPGAAKIPLAYSGAIPLSAATADTHTHFILFGALNRYRPVVRILESFSRFPDRGKLIFHIAGQFMNDGPETSEETVRNAVERLKLVHNVSIHGFVSDDQLDALLGMSKLALNLRDKSHGEASYGQLQIWSHSLPSLVSNLGWFREIPSHCVMHCNPFKMEKPLHAVWNRLLRSDPSLKEMGLRGAQHLKLRHTPRNYVQALFKNEKLPQQQEGALPFGSTQSASWH